MKLGTTFQFLQTPGGQISGTSTEDVQLIYTAGRQLAIRDTKTNAVQMVHNENHSH